MQCLKSLNLNSKCEFFPHGIFNWYVSNLSSLDSNHVTKNVMITVQKYLSTLEQSLFSSINKKRFLTICSIHGTKITT